MFEAALSSSTPLSTGQGDVAHHQKPAIGRRQRAVSLAARHYGVDLDPSELRQDNDNLAPSATALAAWARKAGLWAKSTRLSWRQLIRLQDAGPVVLLCTDGGAVIMDGVDPARNVVMLSDPAALSGSMPLPVDALRLEEVWVGEVLLLRNRHGLAENEAPFSMRWLRTLLLQERRSLRDIGIASLALSFLTIFPPLVVMTVVDKVLTYQSESTLRLLVAILVIALAHETLIAHARRTIVLIVGTRIDTRLNLHVFARMLRLSIEYFECHPAGETMYKISQIQRVREFLTGRLLTTFLDLFTLLVLLPVLFYINVILASLVFACAVAILAITLISLYTLRPAYAEVTAAETARSAALAETIAGIRTIKALAIERPRSVLWDLRIADVGTRRLAFGWLANWPQTLITPIERFMSFGIILIGAYMALGQTGYLTGSLFAFMMLSSRLAQPLVGLARLVEDYESFCIAIGQAASVVNQPAEQKPSTAGVRPAFSGAIGFDDVTFTYRKAKTPALNHISFEVPAGTMLGIVGRSGSGKSTIARLLQGINRDYTGFLKVDGVDLREIDLGYLRSRFGIVLQDNFLFRGSIRDNIIAGRPGLVMDDVMRAARLAGADEFIERLPNGYGTLIEEGSPNLSGGQKQRLAIARALAHDPRILILDEATNALDPESEVLVNANLQRIARERTMVIVSHRLSSLTRCDQILVLDQGRKLDLAPHQTLLERCHFYRHLWSQQSSHINPSDSFHVAHAPALVVSR